MSNDYQYPDPNVDAHSPILDSFSHLSKPLPHHASLPTPPSDLSFGTDGVSCQGSSLPHPSDPPEHNMTSMPIDDILHSPKRDPSSFLNKTPDSAQSQENKFDSNFESEDEAYINSLWSLKPRGISISLRSSLHLSLKHSSIKTSLLSREQRDDKAELSGFMIQKTWQSKDTTGSNRANLNLSVGQNDVRRFPVNKTPKTTRSSRPELRYYEKNPGDNVGCVSHTKSHSGHSFPGCHPPSINSNFSNNIRKFPAHDSDPEQIIPEQQITATISNKDELPQNSEPLEFNGSIDEDGSTSSFLDSTKLSNFKPISSPSPLYASSIPQTPNVKEFPPKRSHSTPDSDSSDDLPEITFVESSRDDSCFITSTTTPRMARELNLSPTNVTLAKLEPSDLFDSNTNAIKQESVTEALRQLPIPSEFSTHYDSFLTDKQKVFKSETAYSTTDVVASQMKKTPLVSVTKSKEVPNLESISILRKHGVNMTAPTDKFGDTRLHRLCQMGRLNDVKQAVLERHIPINSQDNAGWTALHEACSSNHFDIAAFLLQHGANPNIISNDGTAPVHDAISRSDISMLKLLVSHGADPLLYQGDISPLDMESTVSIRDYLRQIGIQRAQYLPGLPVTPELPTSPTSFVQPANLSTYNKMATFPVKPLDSDAREELFYVTPVFDTSYLPFVNSFFLPITTAIDCSMMANFYFLPHVLERLDISYGELFFILPDLFRMKLTQKHFLEITHSHAAFVTNNEKKELEFVADTRLLRKLLRIDIHNMEI